MKFSILVILILFVETFVDGRPDGTSFRKNCGYERCPETPTDQINIHLVPHTHDDVGWLKTVDQYYYGDKPLIQKANVESILDAVVDELLMDPMKRFVYVESAFFFKWFEHQTPELQLEVKKLVDQGRLEFIGGAWSMNDEATTHYQSIIDQFALGLRRLNETFGECGRPKVGWQIDPFGHSREMASIFAEMGYDGMFFARLDWEDKSRRFNKKAAEMIWHGNSQLGKSSDLFIGILSNHYSAPPGFCFDYLCNDEPIMDGHGSANNVKERLDTFYDYIKNMTKLYATNNIMVPMGDDFNYQDANKYFKNMDKLIKYSKGRKVNGQDVNIFYSTPSCYLKSLHETNITWPTESDDFFPYSTDPYTYWSGYYTSRPTLKYYERISNNFLQICKQLTTDYLIYNPDNNNTELIENLNELKEAMGVMQHHDAVTGTEKQPVADDYARILNEATEKCNLNTKKVLKHYIDDKLDFQTCSNLNISECDITETSKKFMVTMYNPLSHNVDEIVRLPIHEGSYSIRDEFGEQIKYEIVTIPKTVLAIPNRFSVALKELIFMVTLKPGKLQSYFIERNSTEEIKIKKLPLLRGPEEQIIKFDNIELKFINKLLSSIKTNGVEQEVNQEFFYYDGAAGNNMVFENRSSGAYIFRPNGTAKPVVLDFDKIQFHFHDGFLVKEIYQNFIQLNTSQIIRIYPHVNFVEFNWLVGPIPVEDKIGKEIVTRFTTNIKSNGLFYTDSNGRQMMQRKFNNDTKLKSWQSANYYPITTKISIEDDKQRMSIFTDRSQGGGSLDNGCIELMLHRRLLHDDAFGVGEALNETAYGVGLVARGKHYLHLGPNASKTKQQERILQMQILLKPWMFFSDVENLQFENWQELVAKDFVNQFYEEIPENINLMTIESWGYKKILIRVENFFEQDDGQSTKFNLKSLMDLLNGIRIRETTLDGNQWLDETKRMEFKYSDTSGMKSNSFVPLKISDVKKIIDDKEYEIELKPMQIRTFIVDVQ